ncbi:MAG TPA: hypothetical protein VEI73_18470, partial [Candidatus Acidoferrum sp.]|nr:hypothetical protein [Candidatus Acidoferrum sp.]
MHSDPQSLSRRLTLSGLGFVVILFGASHTTAQNSPVRGKVEVTNFAAAKQSSSASRALSAAEVVVWLSPMDADSDTPSSSSSSAQLQLIQRNKSFEPHVLAVRVGSVVQFPNKDPFFHNVFSLFDGKRFDLG